MSITMLNKKNFSILTLFFIIFFTACSSSHNTIKSDEYRQGLLLTREMTNRFGEYYGNLDYLVYIKGRLLQHIPDSSDTSYKIVVLNSNDLMAFSPGGGYILISKGLIKRCKKEAELAFIIAHEISHQYLGHTTLISGTINPADRNPYSKKYELAADKLAIAMLASAGYDPNLSISALISAYYYMPAVKETNLSHPDLEERIASIKSAIATANWQPPGTIDRRSYQVFLKSIK